jgi:hypothetical protein
MKIVPTSDRLNSGIFSSRGKGTVVKEGMENGPPFYTCGRCQEKVGFSFSSFERHQRLDFSNLSDQDAEIASGIAAGCNLESHGYLDFYCPQCQGPARIYFQYWDNGDYSDTIIIDLVIE